MTMTVQARKPILIGLASLLFAMFFNFLNVHCLKADGIELRDGQTVITSDDASYLAPPDNFFNGNGWKSNSAGINSHYLRSPGYGCIYLLFKILFSHNPFLWLKIFQILLFAVSSALLYEIAKWFVRNEFASACVAVIYGCTPFACGFLSYTLTEGVTPAFVIVYLYTLVRYVQKRKMWHLLLSAIVFALLFVIRPALGIFLPLQMVAVWSACKKNLSRFVAYSAVALCLALLPMLMWQVRNWQISGRFVGLHPIYSTDSPDLFRPAHKSAWNFAKTWSPRGDEFHSSMLALWNSAVEGDSAFDAVGFAMSKVPQKVLDCAGSENVRKAYSDYYQLLCAQAPFFKNVETVPDWFIESEKSVVSQFDALARVVRAECPFMYHLSGPLCVYGRMSMHSNLSMYMFQKTFRGNAVMKFARLLFYALHALLFVLIWVALLQNRRNCFKFAIIAVVAMYIVYLAWFQRGIEERYTLPVLPVLLVSATDAVVRFAKKIPIRNTDRDYEIN